MNQIIITLYYNNHVNNSVNVTLIHTQAGEVLLQIWTIITQKRKDTTHDSGGRGPNSRLLTQKLRQGQQHRGAVDNL